MEVSTRKIFIVGGSILVGGLATFFLVRYLRGKKQVLKVVDVSSSSGINTSSQNQILQDSTDDLAEQVKALVGQDEEEQMKTLKRICSMSSDKNAKKQLKELNVVPGLLALFETKPKDPKVAAALLKAMRDLCADRDVRKVVAKDLNVFVSYLSSKEPAVAEYSLRSLVNLTLEAENETKFRECHGIPVLLQLLQDETITQPILLQTVRLLVNLSFNEKNRQVITNQETLTRVLGLLEKYRDEEADDEEDSDDEDGDLRNQITIRLVRILGSLAATNNVEIYKQITTPKVLELLFDLLEWEDEILVKFVFSTIAGILRSATTEEFLTYSKRFVQAICEHETGIERFIEELDSTNDKIRKVTLFLLQFLFESNQSLFDKWKNELKEKGVLTLFSSED